MQNMIKSDRENNVVLSVKNLKTYYPILGGLFRRTIGYVKAVDGVSFDLHKEESIGLVGESGCGKTTIGNTILNLVPATSGEIFYKNQSIIRGSNQKKERSQHQREQNDLKNLILTPIIYIIDHVLGSLVLQLQSYIKKIYQIIKNYLAKIHPSMQNIFIATASLFRRNYLNFKKISIPYNKVGSNFLLHI